MKKRILAIAILMAMVVGTVSAKDIGLRLDVGAQYNNHETTTTGGNSDEGTYIRTSTGKHMGGFNIALSYAMTKNWDVFLETEFSFNKLFVNDTLVGFGYNFDLGKGFESFVGGGFSFGGNIMKKSSDSSASTSYAYVGAGVTGDIAWMFTSHVGIYAGATLNIYGVPSGKVKTSLGSSKINKAFLPKMARSLNFKTGVRIRL